MTTRIRTALGSSNRPATRWRHEPDVVLMLRVQADEPGAFAELIELYWSRIFGRFYRQLGDRQEAEDLAQDVFLRLYRNRRRYEPRARFGTWLYHIARNVARNAIRTRRRRPCLPLGRIAPQENEESLEDQLRSRQHETPSRPVEREELARVVRKAMAGLGGRQRVALELQFQDHSYSEIAAELDMTPKAAKSLLYRARLQLRADLYHFMTADA